MHLLPSVILVITAASIVAALPTPRVHELDRAEIYVSGLSGSADPQGNGVFYELEITGIGPGDHVFPKTKCRGQNQHSAAELGPVEDGRCDNNEVFFTFLEDEEDKGWTLTITHEYTRKYRGRLFRDIAKHRIPKSQVGLSGQHEYILEPHHFTIPEKSPKA